MRAGIPVGLFLFAFAVRSLPLPMVWTGDRVQFLGMDSYYHMRRVLYGLERFPSSLGFDRYINFPDGAVAIWPPLFDILITWVALPFYWVGGVDAAESALIWAAPTLGALTVVAVYFLGLRFFGFGVALAAGLILAVMSGHYWYSQVGFLDHHAAVALATTLLIWSAMSLLEKLAESGAFPGLATLALGCALAGNLLLWPGSLLHVGLVEAGLIVFALGRAPAADLERRARCFAAVQLVALVLVLPFSWTNDWANWGVFSPTVLSRFQPWLFGAVAVYFALTGALAGAGTNERARPAVAVALGVAILVASAILLPDLREGALEAWQWLAKKETFQASVMESRPLFVVRGSWSAAIAEGRLSYFIYLLPVALVFLAWNARKRNDRASLWLLLGWTLGLAVITSVQRRFFNSLSVALALIMAWSFIAAARHLIGPSAGSVRKWGTAAAAAVFGIWLLTPMEASYRLAFSNIERALSGGPILLRTAGPDIPALVETAAWIRENTPTTVGFLDPSEEPEYGLLTLPGVGHLFEYRARRPVVSDNFGDDIGSENYAKTQRYFSTDSEEDAEAIAIELRARYIVATTPNPRGSSQKDGPMLGRLAFADGNGLAGLRLVFEASRLGASSRPHLPPPKVFERVKGARVSGRAPAGVTVVARIGLRTNRDRQFTYRQRTRADADGVYTLRLPYASDSRNGGTRAAAAWRIESGGEKRPLGINEAEVRTGGVVSGPVFGS